MGSGFPGKKGRDGGINRKKMGGKAGFENPIVDPLLSQINTRLRFLRLPYDIEVMWRKTIKHALSMFHTLIKHGFWTNQRSQAQTIF